MDVRKTVAVVTANLGEFDKIPKYVEQSLPYDFHYYNDLSFPPRSNSMTSRLQARIPKMFSWQMAPGYEYYLWVDASCRLSDTNSLMWFIQQIGQADIAVFRHPHRKTVQDEADYIKHRLAIDCPYITPRYQGELINEQLRVVNPKAQLFASTAFIYRNTPEVQAALKEWWYHTSRFHTIDQLGLPEAIKDLHIKVMPENYLKIPYLEYVRNK